MCNQIDDTDFYHICIECSGQRQGKYQQTLHNITNHPYIVLLSVHKSMHNGRKSKNIPEDDPHYLHVQCNLAMYF